MTRLNPADSLVIDLRELSRRPGSWLTLERTGVAADAIGTDVLAVPPGGELELELRLESVVEGVLVTGSVHATGAGLCVRCLDAVKLPVGATFQELYVYPDKAAHHHEVATEDDEDEVRELDGDLLDLRPLLRDALVPTLPFQPVCRPDCPGLCSECGARLADDPGHAHEVLDPRWAALQALSPGSGSDGPTG